jgi:hypothetical protein
MAKMENKEPNSLQGTVAPNSSQARERSRWKGPLLTFAVTVLVVWGVGAFACPYLYTRLIYNTLENEAAQYAGSSSGIPINTLYTTPTLASPSRGSGGNHDTLYTLGRLDLSTGPEVLHVPDMADRYYSVQMTDPWGTDFAYVGRRTTGTKAGDYLISGPGWQGKVPVGMKQIVSPNNTVLLLGRTLVESDGDLATAYGLAKQIQLTELRRI